MIPIGYMAKRIHRDTGWLKNGIVEDIYALSGCISEDFADYIGHWQHNGYWLFDSPTAIRVVAEAAKADLRETVLFYYEAYEQAFDEEAHRWSDFAPTPSLPLAVEQPEAPQLQGFDVVTYAATTGPECSPLSCNSLAESLPVNRHCLFETFEVAKEALETGAFDNSEPGPFRIIAVYTVGNSVNPRLAPGNRSG